jgi:hypothetical protein
MVRHYQKKKKAKQPKDILKLRTVEEEQEEKERRLLAAKKDFLEALYKNDWHEKPVDILTFVKDPQYLGVSTNLGQAIYPKWLEALEEIFLSETKYLIIFTGCIGSGKSYIASIGLLYVMYLIMCLENPWDYLKKSDSGEFAISFFNLKKSMSETVGFNKIQHLMKQSQWFRDRAVPSSLVGDKDLRLPLFDYVLSSPYSQGFGVQGSEVIAGILDEVDSPTAPVRQKERVIHAYQSTMARFRNRFVRPSSHTGIDTCIGKLFVVSSKQDNLGFIDTFIAEKKNQNYVLVYDYKLWDVLPENNYPSKKWFTVAVPTDTFHMPKILKDEEKPTYEKDGYQLIQVPQEHRQQFEENLVLALRDFAGMTMHSSRRNKLFKSEIYVKDCFDTAKPDPVRVMTIPAGLKDNLDLMAYVDINAIRIPKSVPRYIHMDFGLRHDALSIACTCCSGYDERDVEQQDGTFAPQRVQLFETDWLIRIKAKENDSIPISAVRKFIIDLKRMGFNIKEFTADLHLVTADFRQILEKAGIKTDYQSVDKTDIPYLTWRDLVYDRRWTTHTHAYLLFEAKYLEYDQNTGKINHPDKVEEVQVLGSGEVRDFVMEGSKDCSDAVAGSLFRCVSAAGTASDPGRIAALLRHTEDKGKEDTPEDLMTRLLEVEGGKTQVVLPNAAQKFKNQADILKGLR